MSKITVIFYTDDDQDDLDFFEDAARSLNVELDIYLFLTHKEMLAAVDHGEIAPDIIFTDQNMPVISGSQVIKAVRDYGLDIPIVVLSTANDPKTVKKVYELGANYYIPKPHDLSLLQKAISLTINRNWDDVKETHLDNFKFEG